MIHPEPTRTMTNTDSRPILCGTDFSEDAMRAANAAAAIAQRLGVPLLLVHSVDERGEFPASLHARFMEERRSQLAVEAARLRDLGATVEERVLGGLPDDGIVNCVVKSGAQLVVVAASGTGRLGRWMLGSVAERTAESSPVPTLVVRSGAAMEQWARGRRTLKIFVGADFTASSDTALRWVASLRRIGACEVVAAYLDWPPEERARLGLFSESTLLKNPPDVQQVLERDLWEKVTGILGGEGVRVRVRGEWERVDAAILALADEERADLVVLGTHQWRGFSRLRHGSVSRAVLHEASMSVACVPASAVAPMTTIPVGECRRVLVAVDIDASHGFAAPHAYSIVSRGGTVRLIHVGTPGQCEPRTDAETKLRALIPADAEARGITTEVEVVEDANSAAAICQAAERFNADVVCVGAHTRPGMTAKLFGSVSLGVLQRCERPVLIVRPPRP